MYICVNAVWSKHFCLEGLGLILIFPFAGCVLKQQWSPLKWYLSHGIILEDFLLFSCTRFPAGSCWHPHDPTSTLPLTLVLSLICVCLDFYNSPLIGSMSPLLRPLYALFIKLPEILFRSRNLLCYFPALNLLAALHGLQKKSPNSLA